MEHYARLLVKRCQNLSPKKDVEGSRTLSQDCAEIDKFEIERELEKILAGPIVEMPAISIGEESVQILPMVVMDSNPEDKQEDIKESKKTREETEIPANSTVIEEEPIEQKIETLELDTGKPEIAAGLKSERSDKTTIEEPARVQPNNINPNIDTGLLDFFNDISGLPASRPNRRALGVTINVFLETPIKKRPKGWGKRILIAQLSKSYKLKSHS
jgi:hypothetical protein